MNPESKFSRKLASQVFYDADVQRIENTAGSGVPDMNVCWHGVELWVETKVATPGGLVLLRPYQWSWIKRRHSHRGRVIVLALCGGCVRGWLVPQILVRVHGPHLAITSLPSCAYPVTSAGMALLRSYLASL